MESEVREKSSVILFIIKTVVIQLVFLTSPSELETFFEAIPFFLSLCVDCIYFIVKNKNRL